MKKETLEEAAEKRIPTSTKVWDLTETRRSDFIAGAKWQAERSYSEEDMISYSNYVLKQVNSTAWELPLSPKEWFTKFIKKA